MESFVLAGILVAIILLGYFIYRRYKKTNNATAKLATVADFNYAGCDGNYQVVGRQPNGGLEFDPVLTNLAPGQEAKRRINVDPQGIIFQCLNTTDPGDWKNMGYRTVANTPGDSTSTPPVPPDPATLTWDHIAYPIQTASLL